MKDAERFSALNASQYLKFELHRSSPAQDLADRIRFLRPARIIDIGCGPGNSTRILRETFPDARLEGIDSSAEMIGRAREENPGIEFSVGDALNVEQGADLLFSNACLQWLGSHETLFPLLIERLNPGGTLAVQMPKNEEEPLFRAIAEIASEKKWNFAGRGVAAPKRVHSAAEYYGILCQCADSVDIWETRYQHQMPDSASLVEWVKGTRLRPYLAALNGDEAQEFEGEVLSAARSLYAPQKNGTILFGFNRLFIVARKAKA